MTTTRRAFAFIAWILCAAGAVAAARHWWLPEISAWYIPAGALVAVIGWLAFDGLLYYLVEVIVDAHEASRKLREVSTCLEELVVGYERTARAVERYHRAAELLGAEKTRRFEQLVQAEQAEDEAWLVLDQEEEEST